jgi:Bacterial tandem repeat domain 1
MNITRRAVILSGSAAVLMAHAAPTRASSFAWQARHGMDTQQFQAIFDGLLSQGYRLVHVSGYEVNGSPQFAGIWHQTPGSAWIARDNLSSEEYQRAFDQLLAQGYRPVRVSGYESGDEALYAAIWTQSEGPGFEAHHGMTSDQYQGVFDRLTSQGYRLTWVSGYAVGGQALYAAIFEQKSGPTWFARHGLTSRAYQAAVDDALSKGFRVQHVCGYCVDDESYFAAIWQQWEGRGWQARHNLTSAQYQAAFDDCTRRGMRLVDVSGYAAGDEALYAALWLQD